MTEAYYQSLFQRLSDEYFGVTILDSVASDGCRISFYAEDTDLVSTCNLKYEEIGGIELISVGFFDDASAPVYVSPIPSAVIAVCTR